MNDAYFTEHGWPKSPGEFSSAALERRVDEISEAASLCVHIVSMGEAEFMANSDDGALRRAAAERCIQVIAEATRKIHSDFKERHPEIPWRDIYAMRNRITHEYGDLNDSYVWAAISVDIPGLVILLREGLAADTAE